MGDAPLRLRPDDPDRRPVRAARAPGPGRGRGWRAGRLRPLARQALRRGADEGVGRLRRRGRDRRGRGRAGRGGRLPAQPRPLHEARCERAPRRPALGAAGHRQDAARAGRRGRGRRAVLLALGVGVHRGHRRRRREPRARPLHPGQGRRPGHHLHRRARRHRPLPRRRRQPRRPRRARADAEPDPDRDGRLLGVGGRHRDRLDQPPRGARLGAAPARAGSTAASP